MIRGLFKTAKKMNSMAERDVDFARASNVILGAIKEYVLATEAGAKLNADAFVTEYVSKFANFLDQDGFHRTADLLDLALYSHAELPESASDRNDKYDAKQHNADSLFSALKQEYKVQHQDNAIESYNGGSHALQTRYSPDFPGVNLMRISDGVYQDMMTHKVYDFNRGFTSESGEVFLGGSTAHQTPPAESHSGYTQVFETKGLTSRPK